MSGIKHPWEVEYISTRGHFSNKVAVSFIGGGNRNTRRKPRPVASHWQTWSHNVVHRPRSDFIGSCKSNYHKSNYHTITATTTHFYIMTCIGDLTIEGVEIINGKGLWQHYMTDWGWTILNSMVFSISYIQLSITLMILLILQINTF
jgi:hypothetical protein